MGWNTVAVILNDATHAIEGDAEFGVKVASAMRRFSNGKRIDIGAHGERGSHGNAMTILSHAHADGYQLVVVHGNTGYVVTSDPDDGVPPEIVTQIETKLKLRKRAASKRT